MSRSRKLALLGVVLLGTVALSACGPEPRSGNGTGPSSGEELSVAEADARMAGYREVVREQTAEVGRAVARSVRGELKFAVGRYTLCTDDGAGWAYDSSGRLDPPAGAERPLRAEVGKALEGLGYQVEERVEPSGDSRLIGDKGKVTVTVSEDAESPVLLYRVSSPCLIVPEEQRKYYPKAEPSPDIVPNRM